MPQDAVVAVVEGGGIGWPRVTLVLVAVSLSVASSYVADALHTGVAVRAALAGGFMGLAGALTFRSGRRR